MEPERDDLAGDLAVALSAAGRHDDALAEMARLVARDPNDPQRRLRLADAQAAAGQATAARETIAALLAARPEVPEVHRAARALGVPLPLDGFRVDGRAIIRAFEAAAVRYTAPAVMVLDRAVMRIFPDGTVMTLTHQIVRVDSKDAVDKWAEIAVPRLVRLLRSGERVPALARGRRLRVRGGGPVRRRRRGRCRRRRARAPDSQKRNDRRGPPGHQRRFWPQATAPTTVIANGRPLK